MKREKISFDKDWFFHKGDINTSISDEKGVNYIGGKTERYHVGPAAKDYYVSVDSFENNMEHKTESWVKVDLPHDYLAGEVPDKKYNCALGFVNYENAWYIKKFKLTDEDRGKHISLLFEGVATHATVYLNGGLMKHNFCGYTSFEVDISDMVRFNEVNTLSVYVDTREHEGWWYEGGGIYRHVYMIKNAPVSVDLYGIYARPKFLGDEKWDVDTEITVRNDSLKTKRVTVKCSLLDSDGNTVATAEGKGSVLDKDKNRIFSKFSVDSPKRWSPETPYQYTVKADVYVGKELTDSQNVKFGFRTFSYDTENGFTINGKPYKIKGVCDHESSGFFGKAVPDNVHRYKVRLMKEMGVNGYRTSHYMQSEALMDAFDENGIIVMNEPRWYESTDEAREQLITHMKRDRNRPSVFFWSLGNEEYYHETDEGRRIMQSLISLVRKYDPDKMITAACDKPKNEKIFDLVDVIGLNYNLPYYKTAHENYPDKCIVATENCAVSSTRGWYHADDNTRAYRTAYDEGVASFSPYNREYNWKFMMEKSHVLGAFQWTAFEYKGEAIWPRIGSQCGAVDLYLQKKDVFYVNKALWTEPEEKAVLHLMPHWSFNGFEGEKIKVCAYTNAPAVELFLNGRSLGKQSLNRYDHAEWQVPYEAGELTAKAYNKDGDIIATETHKTAGRPYRLMLSLDNADDLRPCEKDAAIISCYVVDENGIEVPTAEPLVHFTAEGAGTVYSTGSDVAEHDSVLNPDRKMRAGRIGVAVKMNSSSKTLKVYAEADGLISAVLTYKFN